MKQSKAVKNNTTYVMVVDIGTIFLKYSLFANFNGLTDYLLKFEIKYMNEIYSEGTINYNLFKRDLRRKIEEFSKLGEIDTVIIIPQRIVNESVCLPRFEYRESQKDYRDSIKQAFRTIENNMTNVYDWSKLDDQPENDYQSILIDSVPEDMIMNLNDVIVGMGVKEFIITSPLTGYLNIFEADDKAHAIVDVGHSNTRVTVVKNNIIYLTKDRPKAGNDITEALAKNHNSAYEAMVYKHNSDIHSLPTEIDTIIDEIKEVIKTSCEDYANNFNDVVQDYCMIGGTANFEIEEEINKQTVGIGRVYPKLDLYNDSKLLMESRNYLYPSYSTFKFYIENKDDKEKIIDFSASKSGGIGLKVKALVRNYNKFKTPLIAGLAGLYLISVSAGFFSNHVYGYGKEVEKLKNEYDSRLQSVTTEHESSLIELQNLNAENQSQKGSNTGLLLERIKKLSPKNVNIKELQLLDDGSTGIMIVKSDSQVAISSFLVLLQDPIEGVFNRVTVSDIQLKENLGEKYYETTINIQGKNM